MTLKTRIISVDHLIKSAHHHDWFPDSQSGHGYWGDATCGLWFRYSVLNYHLGNSNSTGRSTVAGIVQFKSDLTSSTVHVRDRTYNPVIIYGILEPEQMILATPLCALFSALLHLQHRSRLPVLAAQTCLSEDLSSCNILGCFLKRSSKPPSPIQQKYFFFSSRHLLPLSFSCFHKHDKPLKRLEVINAASNWKREWQVCLGTGIGKCLYAHYI